MPELGDGERSRDEQLREALGDALGALDRLSEVLRELVG